MNIPIIETIISLVGAPWELTAFFIAIASPVNRNTPKLRLRAAHVLLSIS
jgi:hypothetical protein